jgi:hypothetical protein
MEDEVVYMEGIEGVEEYLAIYANFGFSHEYILGIVRSRCFDASSTGNCLIRLYYALLRPPSLDLRRNAAHGVGNVGKVSRYYRKLWRTLGLGKRKECV